MKCVRYFFLNPVFRRTTTRANRRRWAKALRDAEDNNIGQATGRMLVANQHQTSMCCLMVGHAEWGGVDSQRTTSIPLSGPFVDAFGSTNPSFALVGNNPHAVKGSPVSATAINDNYRLTFREIAAILNERVVKKEISY